MHPPADAQENDPIAITPTTPRRNVTTTKTNAPARQSQRNRAPSRKSRENEEQGKDNEDEPTRGAQHRQMNEAQEATECASNNQLTVAFTTTLTIGIQAMERRMIERIESLKARMIAEIAAKIAAVTQQHESYEARLTKLET